MSQLQQDEEPILWAKKAVRERTSRKGGRRVLTRFPQTARNQQGVKRRWVKMVDAFGNVCRCVLTNAAADLNIDGPYAQKMKAKWRHLGWFPLAKCPLALVAVGDLSRSQLDESLHKQKPCESGAYSESKPCKHALAEIELRRAVQDEELAERLPKLKDLAEQMRDQAEEQATQNQELVKGMADAFKEALSGMSQQPESSASPGDQSETTTK